MKPAGAVACARLCTVACGLRALVAVACAVCTCDLQLYAPTSFCFSPAAHVCIHARRPGSQQELHQARGPTTDATVCSVAPRATSPRPPVDAHTTAVKAQQAQRRNLAVRRLTLSPLLRHYKRCRHEAACVSAVLTHPRPTHASYSTQLNVESAYL